MLVQIENKNGFGIVTISQDTLEKLLTLAREKGFTVTIINP